MTVDHRGLPNSNYSFLELQHTVPSMRLFHNNVVSFSMTAALLLEAVSAKTGSFDFLTYNVAGLPAILNPNQGGDKAVNARAIGTKLAAGAYDVVHLQEVSPLTAIYSDPNTYSFQSGFQLPCLYLRDGQSPIPDRNFGRCPFRKWFKYRCELWMVCLQENQVEHVQSQRS